MFQCFGVRLVLGLEGVGDGVVGMVLYRSGTGFVVIPGRAFSEVAVSHLTGVEILMAMSAFGRGAMWLVLVLPSKRG